MIHLLWCTIRQEVFKQMHPYWIGRSTNTKNIKRPIPKIESIHLAALFIFYFWLPITSPYMRRADRMGGMDVYTLLGKAFF